jgi:hypothetical protein
MVVPKEVRRSLTQESYSKEKLTKEENRLSKGGEFYRCSASCNELQNKLQTYYRGCEIT